MTINTFLSTHFELSASDVLLVSQCCSEIEVACKTILQEEGKRDSYLYIVKKGLVKSYITRDAKEVTIMVADEGKVLCSSPIIKNTNISDFSLQTLESCQFIKISREKLCEALSQSITLANWGRELVETWLKENTDYYLSMYWLNKTQQYKYLLANYPSLIRRMSVNDIASWLNITPQSLSRIRAEID